MDLDRAFSLEALGRHFAQFVARHYDVIVDRPRVVPGADRIQFEHFVRDSAKHFAAIRRKVLDGRYTFAPYLEYRLPKPGSTDHRTISVAGIRDAVVQRALYEHLYPEVDPLLTDSVFGYRRGRTAQAAITTIRGHFAAGRLFVFDADFMKFFDTIDHDILRGKVDALPIDPRAKNLVYRFMKTRRITPEVARSTTNAVGKQRKYPSAPRDLGVPQGGILSGLLTNLYLADFDRGMREVAPGYVRYADDFIACCDSRPACEVCRTCADQAARALQIQLHPTKSVTCREMLTESLDFLGFRLRASRLSVRSSNIARFKQRISNIISEHRQLRKSTPEEALRRLCNSLAFKIRGPDAAHRQKLLELGLSTAPQRRSWIGFFRNVDDLHQVRQLDRWIRAQVSWFMWRRYRHRVRLNDMRLAGLPSLMNHLYRARKRATFARRSS